MQRLTGDYPAATASHARALKLYRDLGNRLGEANALNNMGELSLVSARFRPPKRTPVTSKHMRSPPT